MFTQRFLKNKLGFGLEPEERARLDAAIHRARLFRPGRLDALRRVAHFLCETDTRLVSAELSDGHRFVMGLTPADLAEICGLTSAHVNRVLRHLRQDGLCVCRSSFGILDPDRLVARGQFDPAYLYRDPAPAKAPPTMTASTQRKDLP